MKNSKKLRYIKGYLFLVPNFIGFFLFMFIPIIMGFAISFTDYDGFLKFNFVGIDNYTSMFLDDYFLVSLKNNILYTLITVPATIILAILLAVALNTGIKGNGIFKAFIIFLRSVPWSQLVLSGRFYSTRAAVRSMDF